MTERWRPTPPEETESARESFSPQLVATAFSQYGLGLQLIQDSFHIEEKDLFGKLPPLTGSVYKTLDPEKKEMVESLRGRVFSVFALRGKDEFLHTTSNVETELGSIHSAIRFAQRIRSPHSRFMTLLGIGMRFSIKNDKAKDALIKARETTEEIGVLHEKVEALAWSGWIDKRLGKEDSHAFDGATIAFQYLTDQARTKAAHSPNDASTANWLTDSARSGCTLARVAQRLEKDPRSYLAVSKELASNIIPWSDFVPLYSHIAKTEKNLGLDYTATLSHLKEKITVEDERIHSGTIHFWLRVVELEKELGENWQETFQYVRELCRKGNYAAGYTNLAEFEVKNGFDPTDSLQKAKKQTKRLEKSWEKTRLEHAIPHIEQVWEDQNIAYPSETVDFVSQIEEFGQTIEKTIYEVMEDKNVDRRIEGFLQLATVMAQVGISPLVCIDLAKKEIYASSKQISFSDRLKTLGEYQLPIGAILHTFGSEVLSNTTDEEFRQAISLMQEDIDNFALIGLGAFIPVENHEEFIETLNQNVQDRFKGCMTYGAALTQ